MTQKIFKKVTVCVLILSGFGSIILTTGCDVAAKYNQMVPDVFDVTNKHQVTVKLNESVGGIETNPLFLTSQISNAEFTQALNDSLIKSGLFLNLVRAGEGDYILDVTILDYTKPYILVEPEITITTKWVLTNSETLLPVFSETISTTPYKTTFHSAVAPKRHQIANEKAVRANIREGIKLLSLLDIE